MPVWGAGFRGRGNLAFFVEIECQSSHFSEVTLPLAGRHGATDLEDVMQQLDLGSRPERRDFLEADFDEGKFGAGGEGLIEFEPRGGQALAEILALGKVGCFKTSHGCQFGGIHAKLPAQPGEVVGPDREPAADRRSNAKGNRAERCSHQQEGGCSQNPKHALKTGAEWIDGAQVVSARNCQAAVPSVGSAKSGGDEDEDCERRRDSPGRDAPTNKPTEKAEVGAGMLGALDSSPHAEREPGLYFGVRPSLTKQVAQ
jgi:hypothetical protein